ncbi:MAG: alpha/beta fold hydrolase [Jatrophihabitantaceae bacterium]
MRRFSVACTALAAALATIALAMGPAAAAPTPLPVPYSFLPTAAIPGGLSLGGPPGANDWSCRPSVAHPEPVVLVHGFLGNASTNWQTYGPLLKNNGYCVYALTYGQSAVLPGMAGQLLGGLAPPEQSAVQVGAFIQRVLTATGAAKVDIVGHSEGAIVPDYYAKYLAGAAYIDKYISLAPLWAGTDSQGLGKMYQEVKALGLGSLMDALLNPIAGSETGLLAGSDFINAIQSGAGPAVAGIAYTNIVTTHDELVQPYTSGIAAGMTNYTVQNFCGIDYTEHFEIAADPVAAALVLNALDPTHPRAVPCRLVLPFIGPL